MYTVIVCFTQRRRSLPVYISTRGISISMVFIFRLTDMATTLTFRSNGSKQSISQCGLYLIYSWGYDLRKSCQSDSVAAFKSLLKPDLFTLSNQLLHCFICTSYCGSEFPAVYWIFHVHFLRHERRPEIENTMIIRFIIINKVRLIVLIPDKNLGYLSKKYRTVRRLKNYHEWPNNID